MPTPKTDIPTRVASIESELRALAAQAAIAGEWPVVRAASLAAENLSGVIAVVEPASRSKPQSSPVKQPKRPRGATKRLSTASGYPRFECEDGDLIKVGWSRSEKTEYRHRAPLTAIDLVARTISKLAKESGGGFTSDALFPIIDPGDGSDVPTYQGYLVLRWFRELGLVEPNGRSEYVVPNAAGLPVAASKSWKDLCTKENA